MGMIKCSDCGKDISDMAQACPNCGRPVKMVNQGNVPVQNVNASQNMYQQAEPAPKAKKKGHGCLVTGALIVCIISVLILMISSGIKRNQETINAGDASSSAPSNTSSAEASSEQQEEDAKVPKGTAGEIDEELVLVVNEVTEADSISAANGYLAYKPDSGKFAVVNVTISNNSKSSKKLLLNYFALIGPDEARYVSSITTGADEKFITVETINPNLEITGNLLFEIPKDLAAEECLLQYTDYDLFSGAVYFELK